MCRFRPDNRPAIAAGNQEKPPAHCGRSIVCRHQLLVLYLVPQLLQLTYKLPECHTLLCLYRSVPSVQRPPGFKLLHVFQHNHPRTDKRRPSERHPGQPPDFFVLWLPALGLTKMLAVWRKPRQCHRMTAAGFYRVNVPYALTVMFCIWMVSLMHPDGFRIMVDCYVHADSGCHLYAGAGTAASGKIVHYQLPVYHGTITSPKSSILICPSGSKFIQSTSFFLLQTCE